MRLAIVTAAFHAAGDDPFVPVWLDMVHALALRADVTVFPLRLPAAGGPYDLVGARVVPLGHGMVRLRRSPALWRSAVRAIDAAHRRRPFDAVLALQAGEAGFVAAIAAARIGRPLQVHVAGGELVCHRAIEYGSRCRWVERAQVALALRRAAVITTGCEDMARRAAALVPVRRARRVTQAPLGIDLETWTSITPRVFGAVAAGEAMTGEATLQRDMIERRDPAVPRLLAVSDFRPIKDHDVLLRAFAQVIAQRPATLDLVGAGETLAAVRTLCRRLGIAERVRYWGWVPPLVRHVPFAAAHAFVHASRHEAQGMALVEAALLGLPIASTRVGVAESLPQAGRAVADVGDAAGLGRAIHWALDAASTPATARAAGRAAVAARYDRHVCANRWIELLRGAVTSPQQRLRSPAERAAR